jgi:leucyl/phenylalanyl-tRNA--protein transferase
MVLEVDKLHVPRSLAKTMRRAPYQLRADTRFMDVMLACKETPRPGQDGTWITEDMLAAYCELHRLGYAHSFEAYDGDQLVGGLYGVSLGSVFFGESMFAHAPDASKIAFVAAVRQLAAWGTWLVDCQVHTDHLERFGAEEWPRARYLTALRAAVVAPTRLGRWQLEEGASIIPSR